MKKSIPLALLFFTLVSGAAIAAGDAPAESPATAPSGPSAAAAAPPDNADQSAQPAVEAAAEDKDGKEIVLTKEEIAEKEARKSCKVDICAGFRNPAAKGNDISCTVMKSWRKEQLVKMVAKLKVSWPYGPVRCTSDIKLKRDELAKAMTSGKHTTQLEKHAVACQIDREKDTASEIKFEFSPKIDFEKGKAIKAKMNWGKIDAPALIKGAMWTATAADNTVNMLSSTLVEDINDFIGKKCDEVKSDWEAAK